eukprot:gnl/MRDRNA2_/MRDRNA2_388429_c0_seq1.p2 gnl/MRDRNA2_/MRDRNA2_388429_c0~~gnl/MRDRNA2_/MRDRNA2_388429_c0_seq1.p2  ORF type:complete len:109 (-),score=9.44 gnl/MRDRNA2_/MRDRNA2_388429_c0_seq1:93-419(-)
MFATTVEPHAPSYFLYGVRDKYFFLQRCRQSLPEQDVQPFTLTSLRRMHDSPSQVELGVRQLPLAILTCDVATAPGSRQTVGIPLPSTLLTSLPAGAQISQRLLLSVV